MSIFSVWFRFPLHILAASAALALVGCTPEEEGGETEDNRELIWEEGSRDNEEPWDAESVDDDWTETVFIEGEMEECGYAGTGDWRYSGDHDSFDVEVPRDGYIAAKLTWDHNSDLDMYIYINGGGQNWRPDESLTNNGDTPEEWVPDDEFESGDDIVFTVVCSQGPGGDYLLEVNWES
jgi:hypothetical protein